MFSAIKNLDKVSAHLKSNVLDLTTLIDCIVYPNIILIFLSLKTIFFTVSNRYWLKENVTCEEWVWKC
jgi:hypothetical protein